MVLEPTQLSRQYRLPNFLTNSLLLQQSIMELTSMSLGQSLPMTMGLLLPHTNLNSRSLMALSWKTLLIAMEQIQLSKMLASVPSLCLSLEQRMA
jgi:hypothetical protein